MADENPFADPSIRQAITASSTQKDGVDDYNPFGDVGRAGGYGAMRQAPISVPQSAAVGGSGAPPPYSAPAAAASGPRLDTSELERKQADLDRRAEELQRREEELRRQDLAAGRMANNFPPLPTCCPIKPCFFHDIPLEIPQQHHKIMRLLFVSWIVHSIVWLFNLVTCMASFIVDSTNGVGFGISLIFFVIFIPCSFLCWYRPVYKAFRSDSSFNFMLFFLMFLIQLLIDIFSVIGISNSGYSGWITALGVNGTNHGAGAMNFICAAIFTALLITDILVFLKVHTLYRHTGASFEKAQQEFRQGAYRNEFVRDAAASAVSGAVSAQVSGNRY